MHVECGEGEGWDPPALPLRCREAHDRGRLSPTSGPAFSTGLKQVQPDSRLLLPLPY
jgi:hypothetical protein